MNEVLQTVNLEKRFGKQAAVSGVSLHIRPGTVYGLLGPNGAGKTTTLKMIAGLLRPSSGEIWVNGKPWSRDCLAEIGALIESPALYGNLTARENLLVHTRLLNLPETRIREVLETVGLTGTGRKKASQFSLGMKQRLGIAIALVQNPKLLILDEPTNGLDPLGIQDLRELIRSFPDRGITVILSSHILTEVEHTADDIGIISGGRLCYEGANRRGSDLEALFMEVVQGNRAKEGTSHA
ncbi:lantibiotic protection ABC transporter ATP-binding subunit [Paenibacillus oralis]|uniref:Lantibiotic protection ABC transporter ATP-binding subunit n=1 Tax=Paenibacillus oralis TaxID=2490856 RepID=A0A3P3U156_9BACL|nr:lantibiotic protection ABC transporter ATP-binding protein [Paenibacillus oralis]RRJ64085.1 lantibiotic protection ABC transporter ATP-binding subunit [Paenibacillus oralis]